MDFSLSPGQQIIESSLADFLSDHYDFDRRRAISNSDSGWDRDLWQSLGSELGILAMTLPERARGLACGPVGTMVVMEEMGKTLVASTVFPKRLGKTREIAALSAHIVENDYINGECIRMDAAIRMQPK